MFWHPRWSDYGHQGYSNIAQIYTYAGTCNHPFLSTLPNSISYISSYLASDACWHANPLDVMKKELEGPLHTRAKSGDNEIVRAQRKCLKAIPCHLQIHVLWWWTLKCSVKSYVIGCSTKCYFNGFSIHGRSSHKIQYNKPKVVRFRSAMVSGFCVRPTSTWWFLMIVQVTMKHDPFDAM